MVFGREAGKSTLPKRGEMRQAIPMEDETYTLVHFIGVSTLHTSCNLIKTNQTSGPSSDNDGFWRTTDGKALRRTDFSEGYHTFGLEWSQNYLFTYLDFQLQVFSFSRPSHYQLTNARTASSIPELQRREKPLATRRLRQSVREQHSPRRSMERDRRCQCALRSILLLDPQRRRREP
jgi:hypothetical protein